jgi:hypothetical protein
VEFRLPGNKKAREAAAAVMMEVREGYGEERPKVTSFLETGDGYFHLLVSELDFHSGSTSKGNYKHHTDGQGHFDGFLSGSSTSDKTSKRSQNFKDAVDAAIAWFRQLIQSLSKR